jgi:hypothetical protein
MDIGHNSGLSPEIVKEQLGQDFAQLTARTMELEAAAKRVPDKVTDDIMSGMIADQVQQFRDHIKALTDAHDERKRPFHLCGKAVDDFFNPTVKGLTAIKDAILRRNTIYLQAKERREREAAEAEAKAAREAAERIANNATTDAEIDLAIEQEEIAEAAQAKAQAPSAELTRLHGSLGTATSLRNFGWKHRNVDRAALDLEKLRPYLPADALDQALRAYIRAEGNNPKPIRGVEFFEDRRAA